MNRFKTLMLREWLQHRFGWTVMLAVPLAIGLLLTSFGDIRIGSIDVEQPGAVMPSLLAIGAIVGTAATVFIIVWFAALMIVSGLARRDHADRSIEFWLSMPIGHAESFLAPLLVHLLLAPAAALLAGLAGGYAMSLVVVGRVVGFGGWLALPWLDIVFATLALFGRALIGLPLATLWLLPLILPVVLLSAWFRKWSWLVFAVGVGLGSVLLDRLFGQPFLSQAINGLLRHALHAMAFSSTGFSAPDPEGAWQALQVVPGWAMADAGRAIADLASPLLIGGLVVAGACFWLLVRWRAGHAGASE